MAFMSFATNLLSESPCFRTRTRFLKKLPSTRIIVSAAGTVCLVDSLSEALQRGYVKQFGDRMRLDPNGFLPQDQIPVIPPEYVSILGDVAAKIRALLARRSVRAIFVRGSTVSGNLLGNFRSDLDLIVFTDAPVTLQETVHLRELLLSKLKKALQVGSVDIRYLDKGKRGKRGGLIQQFRINPTLRIILRYFSAPIYGSRKEVGLSDVPMQPRPYLAVDISNDVSSFRKAMGTKHTKDFFFFQLSAIQWLCKKCLRAVAELAALKMGAYARDLLPCYELGSEAFPNFADILLHGLLIACASPANRYLDMRKDDILEIGTSIALQLAEILEELSLQQWFGTRPVAREEPLAAVTRDVIHPTWRPYDACEKFKDRLLLKFLNKRRTSMTEIEFRRWPLPLLELKGSRFVEIHVTNLNAEEFGSALNFDEAFTNIKEPVVYRERKKKQRDGEDITREVLTHIVQSTSTVQCRVARGHTVTFCRSNHEWLEEGIFTPPSVLISLPVSKAVERLRDCHGLSNLVYDDRDEECVYIQTKAIPGLQLYERSRTQAWEVVQEERLWISSHGTVSTLHYDASYSALYQRCGEKRLLFFPPCCLPQLGIYPLGHPLHRRARVDLTRKDSIIFKKFWEECASKAVEVTLQPGDILLFPPFWSHYTETITGSSKELSISHTLRYVYQ